MKSNFKSSNKVTSIDSFVQDNNVDSLNDVQLKAVVGGKVEDPKNVVWFAAPDDDPIILAAAEDSEPIILMVEDPKNVVWF